MGYSISIKFKNENQKQKMIDFMKENKAIINETVTLPFLGSVKLTNFDIEKFAEDENIPYGPKGKNLIGWKERGISLGLYAVVVWLSTKLGQDFYYYDEKKFYIKKNEKFEENIKETQINEQGIVHKQQIIPDNGLLHKMIEFLSQEESKCEILLNNMENLEEKWKEACINNMTSKKVNKKI